MITELSAVVFACLVDRTPRLRQLRDLNLLHPPMLLRRRVRQRPQLAKLKRELIHPPLRSRAMPVGHCPPRNANEIANAITNAASADNGNSTVMP